MRSPLVSRRMMGVHATALAGMALCGVLGRWQWGRAAVRHSAQNGFYAFEWWSFGIILLVVWVRTIQDELRPAPHPDRPRPAAERQADALVTAASAAADAQDDAEMTAYNDYLAWLAANPRD